MNKLLLIGGACVLLAGCSTPTYTGQGEYFELDNVNLVERDLSRLESVQLADTRLSASSSEPSKRAIQPMATYVVYEGEPLGSALRRWLKSEGYRNVAWSITPEHQALLDAPMEKQAFTGSFKKIWDDIQKQQGFKLHLVQTTFQGQPVAGVYDFDGKARLTYVSGQSLREVVKQVVLNYELDWSDSLTHKRSWLASNDYQFSADYYLLTPWDDIEGALATVLDGYPVTASILDSTGQVFIEEAL
jgi:hypothetical protein